MDELEMNVEKLIMNIDQLIISDRASLKVLQEFDDAVAKLKKKHFVKLKSDSDVMKQGEMGDREFEFTCDKSR